MTYKQIEASREARLWLGQIIAPVCMATVAVVANPQAREAIAKTTVKVKNSIKNKFGKKKEL